MARSTAKWRSAASRPGKALAPAPPPRPAPTELGIAAAQGPCYKCFMFDDFVLARVIHVLALVHWIGGLSAVTTIVLPRARALADPTNVFLVAFDAFERRFAQQVRVSIFLVGLSGLYMIMKLDAWDRFGAGIILVAGPHDRGMGAIRFDGLCA